MFQDRPKTLKTDVAWTEAATSAQFLHHIFVRVSAKGIHFTNVDFRYSTFEAAYFRDCAFDSCNFTGCKFVGGNFHGSHFTGCTFDYAIFERTQIDPSILDTCCPSRENIKARFAQILRVNYQSIGDAVAASKAIVVELNATGEHLYKAWHSNESYYRKKWNGLRRVVAFLEWSRFRLLDAVWGNGEKPTKLLYCAFVVLSVITIADGCLHHDPALVRSYWEAAQNAPGVFFGIASSKFSSGALTAIALARLLLFALFVSVIVRRYSRR